MFDLYIQVKFIKSIWDFTILLYMCAYIYVCVCVVSR